MKMRLAGFAAWLALFGLAACSSMVSNPASTPTPRATDTRLPVVTASSTRELMPSPTPSMTATVAPTPDLSWIQEAPPSDVEYRLPLTTRHLTENTVVLQFELAEPVQARLLLWRQPENGGLQEFVAGEGKAIIEVNNLQPGTEYRATVLVDGEVPSKPLNLGGVWPLLRFKTFHFGEKPLTAAVFGDSGFGDQVTKAIAQQIAAENVDLVLHTGDVVYKVDENPDPPSAYKLKLFRTLQPLLANLPFYPVAGNHEYDFPARWQGQPYYFHAFPRVEAEGIEYPQTGDGRWYSFVQDGIQFLMTDSQTVFGEPGEAEQRAWLAERIEDPTVRYSVVVAHVPPYSLGSHQTGAAIMLSRWGDLLINERVPLILAGHDHNYQRWQVGPTAVVISGGGSAVLYELAGGDPYYRAGNRVSHHVVLEFGPQAIGLTAIDRAGQVIDETDLEIPIR